VESGNCILPTKAEGPWELVVCLPGLSGAPYVRLVLSPELLLHAYRNGLFPMANEDGEIAWFSPDPRAIIPLDGFHVPHGLRRALKKRRFHVRVNTAFHQVIRGCACREETWINEDIINSYCNLHSMGYAHSVEAWYDERLAGGLYGVAIGGAFFGESMFTQMPDASKVALCELVTRLRDRDFALLDIQWRTSHLEKFGAIEVSRETYRGILTGCIHWDRSFAPRRSVISET